MALGGRYRTMFDLQAQRFDAAKTRRADAMTSSPEKRDNVATSLPPALSSMWRLCKLGYRHEPRLIVAAFVLALLAALPDALLAFWFKLLGDGVLAAGLDAGAVRRGRRSASPPRRHGSCRRSACASSAGSATR